MDELNMKIKNYQEKYQEEGAWIYFSPEESIPQQGWKIHISSQIKDSVSIFNICQNVLRDKRCNFKIVKDISDLKILLVSKSFRKHNLLVFQSENRHEDYFDFGVGTLGIYWVLLGYSFPFEIKKEEVRKYERFYKQ